MRAGPFELDWRPERGGRITSLRLRGAELLEQGLGVDDPAAADFVAGGALGRPSPARPWRGMAPALAPERPPGAGGGGRDPALAPAPDPARPGIRSALRVPALESGPGPAARLLVRAPALPLRARHGGRRPRRRGAGGAARGSHPQAAPGARLAGLGPAGLAFAGPGRQPGLGPGAAAVRRRLGLQRRPRGLPAAGGRAGHRRRGPSQPGDAAAPPPAGPEPELVAGAQGSVPQER